MAQILILTAEEGEKREIAPGEQNPPNFCLKLSSFTS